MNLRQYSNSFFTFRTHRSAQGWNGLENEWCCRSKITRGPSQKRIPGESPIVISVILLVMVSVKLLVMLMVAYVSSKFYQFFYCVHNSIIFTNAKIIITAAVSKTISRFVTTITMPRPNTAVDHPDLASVIGGSGTISLIQVTFFTSLPDFNQLASS